MPINYLGCLGLNAALYAPLVYRRDRMMVMATSPDHMSIMPLINMTRGEENRNLFLVTNITYVEATTIFTSASFRQISLKFA